MPFWSTDGTFRIEITAFIERSFLPVKPIYETEELCHFILIIFPIGTIIFATQIFYSR